MVSILRGASPLYHSITFHAKHKNHKGGKPMRKCIPTVLYNSSNYEVYELSVLTCNGEKITLWGYDKINIKHPYKYKDFFEFYADVLLALKSNKFYCNSHIEFGAKCYDIQWIDVSHLDRVQYRIYIPFDRIPKGVK